MTRRLILGSLSFAIASACVTQAFAGGLMDRISTGKSIRIGFASEPPYGFPGENNEPLGIVNTYVVEVLRRMGYKNIEPVVTDWGGLIPGLQAGRFDVITGGLAILQARCANITFSEPMMKSPVALLVKPGNPEKISSFEDIAGKGLTMVTGAGYSMIGYAKKEGVPETNIMQVPGPTEIVAAVVAERASAGVADYLSLREIAKKVGDKIEITDPDAMPEWTANYVGVGFNNDDKDFVAKFNAAQKLYLGTPAMMDALATYGYDEKMLPGDKSSEWLCSNR
ncbi:ectoine/hydroxyectoine ABC transporter substrate-binding protein EhuB [Rhizobium esperanzae]|uniref:Ectoine/hydroxyectoine ABC transporter substrate-binding protein EhuB n=2 Tax=Rhizobium esperanzae TaxID=1967781 RepID=A0A246DKM1_9HYPH|nr:ectoine/hydroxyectoine ABC transporter substrate-binding protein EhuB [Rhizobium esperanzae]